MKNKNPLNKRLAEKKEIEVVKTKAAKTILTAFKKHMEPKLEFRNLDKAQSQIHFDVDHIKGFDGMTLTEKYPKLKTRMYNEGRKLLVIKNTMKLTDGI